MSMWLPVLLLLASFVVTLAFVVYRDGLGDRQPPASHHDWFEHHP